jgi:pimeloyl-ACP methyl ester carboxylesterase
MDSVDEAAQRLRRTHRRLSPELAFFLAEKGTRRRPDGRVEWKHDPLHRTRSPQPFYLAQAEAFWRRITCPTLFITGAESEYHFFNDTERRKCFADGRGVDIEGAGHMIHHDRPDRLAEEVLTFLDPGHPRA